MNERSHKWTWEDFFPPPRPRLEVEADLLSCMMNCPRSIEKIRQLQIPIQFSKPLHERMFKKIDEMTVKNQSIVHPQLLCKLIAAANRKNDFRMVKNVMELARAYSKSPTSDRAIELAALLSELD